MTAATGRQPDGSATLSPQDAGTVAAGLEVAAEFLTERAGHFCEDCIGHPAGACDDHVDDLDSADVFREVATRLSAPPAPAFSRLRALASHPAATAAQAADRELTEAAAALLRLDRDATPPNVWDVAEQRHVAAEINAQGALRALLEAVGDAAAAAGGDRTWTDPEAFTSGIEQGWAEPETDPELIDWPARQGAAAMPFAVVDGRPVNPRAVTGIRHGRNGLGLWGENLMADALVTVTCGGQRYVLMVERGDGYGWAVPGGSVERGETGLAAAVRELAEETGLAVQESAGRVMPARYVPDPRASDEAWAVTVPVHVDLGGGPTDGLPEVIGGDDARRAEWVRADSYATLTASLAERFGGRVFAAHVAMLGAFLGGAR